MSIKNRMDSATLLKPRKTAETLETKTSYIVDRNIDVSISLLAGSTYTNSNTIYSSSTHIGLTKDRNVTIAARLLYNGDMYTITYVSNAGRYSTLFLSLVK